MRDEEYERQVQQGEKVARAWLARKFPAGKVRSEELRETKQSKGFEILVDGTLLHVVRFRVDFLADNRDVLESWLTEHETLLEQRLREAGATPVIIPA